MPRIDFEDGIVVDFDEGTNPTPEDIEDAYEFAKSGQGKHGNIPKFGNVLTNAITAGGRELEKGVGFLQGKPSIVADIATDPTTYVGGGVSLFKGLKSVPKAIGRKFGSQGFGKSILKIQKSNPTGRIDYYTPMMKHIDDPSVSKVLEKSDAVKRFGGDIVEEGGATRNRLSELTLEESQNFLNSIKDEVRQAVKVGNIKPKELGLSRFISDLSQAQTKMFPKFSKTKRNYGIFKNVGKGIKAAIRPGTIGTGAGISAAGTLAHYLTKKSIGK